MEGVLPTDVNPLGEIHDYHPQTGLRDSYYKHSQFDESYHLEDHAAYSSQSIYDNDDTDEQPEETRVLTLPIQEALIKKRFGTPHMKYRNTFQRSSKGNK